MTELDKYKSEVIDGALKWLKEHSGYRWSDVLDYICEHWDLDNEWETYFDELVESANVENFEVFYLRSLNETKYKTDRLPQKKALSILIGNQLIKRLEESLAKEL
jgi:hypothetical protein